MARAEIGIALASAALLLGLANLPPVTIAVASAADHEGDHVRITGWATEVRRGDDWTRFILVDDSHGIPVRLDGAPGIPTDRPIEVEGTLVRDRDRLTLQARHIAWTS